MNATWDCAFATGHLCWSACALPCVKNRLIRNKYKLFGKIWRFFPKIPNLKGVRHNESILLLILLPLMGLVPFFPTPLRWLDRSWPPFGRKSTPSLSSNNGEFDLQLNKRETRKCKTFCPCWLSDSSVQQMALKAGEGIDEVSTSEQDKWKSGWAQGPQKALC